MSFPHSPLSHCPPFFAFSSEGYMYWSVDIHGTLNRALLNGSNDEILFHTDDPVIGKRCYRLNTPLFPSWEKHCRKRIEFTAVTTKQRKWVNSDLSSADHYSCIHQYDDPKYITHCGICCET